MRICNWEIEERNIIDSWMGKQPAKIRNHLSWIFIDLSYTGMIFWSLVLPVSIFIFLQLHYRHMRGQHVIPKSFSTLQPVLSLLERLFACTIDFSSLLPYILMDISSSGLNNLLAAWNFRHCKSWRLAFWFRGSCFGATAYNSWCNFCCLIMEYKMHFQSRNTFVSIAWWIPPKHSHVCVWDQSLHHEALYIMCASLYMIFYIQGQLFLIYGFDSVSKIQVYCCFSIYTFDIILETTFYILV